MRGGTKAKTTKNLEKASAKALEEVNSKTSKWGGRKPGAKNKATLAKEASQEILRNEFVEIVRPHLGEILRGQIELAKGAYTHKEIIDPDTGEVQEILSYKQPPNQKAGEYLFNQVIGKPKDRVEIEGEVRTLVDVIRDLESNDE